MARILLLSNGHGEDLSGALIGKALNQFDHEVDAFPLVGHGKSYLTTGIRVLGKTKEFSTGGLGYTTLSGRITEIVQGQLVYLLGRLFNLLAVCSNYDLLVVIGDVVPVIAAWLTRLPVVTYLVAYSSHYEGKLKLPWLCASCLSSKRFLGIYTRDQLTSDDLTIQLLRNVYFLGNPFMDSVLTNKSDLPNVMYRLGILPGSRRPELDENLLLILSVVELFSEARLSSSEISFDLALVTSLGDEELKHLASSKGWELIGSSQGSNPSQLVRNNCNINIHRNSFAKVLQCSDVLLSMAGTATEQAVGLGKPVVQLVGYGPQFTDCFADAQRRLLGTTIFCGPGNAGEEVNFRSTYKLILDLLERSKYDSSLKKECKKQAKRRLGEGGGSKRIANAITKLLVEYY
ncbi:lipid-A-disaccharide synthase-related protein [Prochlorococcus sp. MIT 1307]|uniref:lipid-A-disaccharide synthase-related protein n=1 Tax=Prochlorococcus sp. MIT 1307 TaxID=3096219 RepID=UPI002A75D0B2|nr:lipid-A-disaccharide synthase-related protein [Prochlorococcus sp. MIT 1307]